MLIRNFATNWILVLFVCVLLAQSAVGKVIYVDANAPTGGNGSSWLTAKKYLRDALDFASSGDEIWVAEGIYTPEKGGYYIPYKRERTFRLRNSVAVYGGFPSTGEPNLADRDPNVYETILSGDLNGDDVEFVNNGENNYHVVNGSNCNETAILDGFIITGGNASGPPPHYAGGGMFNSQANPTLINCTFRVNAADCCGGGMSNEQSSPTLINCAFSKNWAGSGGAIYDHNGSNPTMTSCIFIENWGGAIHNLKYSSPMIKDCLFAGNSASNGGAINDSKGKSTVINCTFRNNSASSGGAVSFFDSNSTLTNCTFKGNVAHSSGGAVDTGGTITDSNKGALYFVNCSFIGNLAPTGGGVHNFSGDPNNEVILTNCTFAGNEASDIGGGIYNFRTVLKVTNCVFWGNSDQSGTDESAQIHYYYDSTPVVTFCCIQDDDPNDMYIPFGGTDSNNIDEYPMFVREPDNGRDGWGVGSNDDFGDVRLRCGSPCFNIGDNNSLPNDIVDLDGDGNTTEWIPFDLDGDSRIIDANVDMGAYEGPTQAFIFDDTYVTVPEDGNTTFGVVLACEPNGFVDVNVAFLSGDEDITVQYGTTLVFDPNNFFEPDYVTLTAAEDIDFFDGTATIRVSAVGISDGYIRATELDNDSSPNQPTLYVDTNATGENNGTSWHDAYTDLQWALFAARESGGIVTEIRVAGGVYKPAPPGGSRSDTFELLNGVALCGGYAGSSGPDPNQRDIVIYETTLSGDLNGDDGPDFANSDENSYHVVTGSGCNETAIIDGFTITAGFANGSSVYDNHKGGGIYNGSGYPTVTNCIFKKNHASTQGGGMYNSCYRGHISGCTFSENSAGSGGGIYNNFYPGPPKNFSVFNCVFVGNTAYEGGGMFNSKICVGFVLEGCEFIGNSANNGGGMNNNFSGVTLKNCTFIGNSTGTADRPFGAGAGMYNLNSTYKLINCTLIRNNGGGIYDASSSATIRNCILWHSSLWEIGLGGVSSVSVSFSNIEGGEDAVFTNPNCTINWYEGNIDVDPNLTPDGHLTADSNCCINNGTLTEAPETDRDGESRPYGAGVDMGSDEFIDADDDGLPDWWENNYFGSPIAAEPNANLDDDWLTNIQEYEYYSSDPNTPPIHVNSYEGPFWTIQEAIDAAEDGDTVLVPMGIYKGTGNRDLDFGGKSIILYATSGATSTIIDCEQSGRAFYFYSGETSTTAVIGFTITNGHASFGGGIRCDFSNPQIRDCLINANTATSSGGGIYCYRSKPTVSHCTISGNTASSSGGGILCGTYGPSFIHCTISGNNAEYGGGVSYGGGFINSPTFIDFVDCTLSSNIPDGANMQSVVVRIQGTVELASNDWVGNNIILTGDGVLMVWSDATLNLDDSIIRCNILGPGTVQVDLDSELIIEGDAVIDLAHETDPNLNGQIRCYGLLRLKDDVNVTDAQVHVNRASFEDNAIIANSVVIAEAGAPFGQFFIEDNVQLWLDSVTADGDRYLDLDPTDCNLNNIHADIIDVNITEGVRGTHGGLFELRGKPGLVTATCDSNNVFFCKADPCAIPPFDPNNWTINRLELVEGAKLNLTNRFDFQAPYNLGGDDEVLYVKELILRSHSVLNTAFNRIYYETLIKEPYARILNVPLLGFSLNNISFDDENDYIARVKHNNFISPDPYKSRIHVKRVVGEAPDPNGMMQMCNIEIQYENPIPPPDTCSVLYNARAKGLFAKSSEDWILIQFEYLFCDPDPNSELVIYLSDTPELLDHNDPCRAEHYIEVARLANPPVGRPGSFSSGRFGVFYQEVSKGHLDFIRGTRMEFELIGPEGTCILINNWDPGIRCSHKCMDVAGSDEEHVVNAVDFLGILSECGNLVEDVCTPGGYIAGCLESCFSQDGVVTIEDAMAVELVALLDDCVCPSCASPGDLAASFFGAGQSSTDVVACIDECEAPLLVAGKRYDSSNSDFLSDRLYGFDEEPNFICGPCTRVNDRLNGKLIRDYESNLYQLNLQEGLARLYGSNVGVVVPNGTYPVTDEPRYGQAAEVYLGWQAGNLWQRPILDAAFDKDGDVYVVPVVVKPLQSENPSYIAAARLELDSNSISVVQLYDPLDSSDNPSGLREIEIDDEGNVYILNAYYHNEGDRLLVYDANSSTTKKRLYLADPNNGSNCIYTPAAMHVSNTTGRLYLASSLNDPSATSTLLYAIQYQDYPNNVETIEITGMGHITDITEDPITGTIWVIGYGIWEIPHVLDSDSPEEILDREPFYEPYIARISCGNDGEVNAVCLSNDPDPNLNLALPLSIVWTGATSEKCGGADLDGTGEINFDDFAILTLQWQQAPGTPSADIYPRPCGDGIVNLWDLAVLVDHWLESGCNRS